MKMKNESLKKIKLVISDVDGVLTDGGMYYSARGDIQKKFHARDGMGIAILSTSRGVVTDDEARNLGVGGEVLCEVW